MPVGAGREKGNLHQPLSLYSNTPKGCSGSLNVCSVHKVWVVVVEGGKVDK